MYIGEKPTNKGIKEFTYLKESSWKRRHKKKIPGKLVPDNTEENYPYKNQLFCRLCGSRLVRHYNPKNKKVFWICNRNKRQGKESCTGVRVPDSVIRAWGSIKGDIYIEGKVDRNGKKRYSCLLYTSLLQRSPISSAPFSIRLTLLP